MEALYAKVKKDIETKITNNEYHAGAFLPSEPELQKYYHVSRTTIREAISHLVADGLVIIVRGKGTQVRPSKLSHKISVLMSFTEIMQQQGIQPAISDCKAARIKPQMEVVSQLNLLPEEEVYEIYRVRAADNEPISINLSYIPCEFLRNFDINIFTKTQSLYNALETHYDLTIQATEDTITAIKATSVQAKILGIKKNDPILCIERLAYDKNNTPVEFCKIWIRGDRYKHSIALRKR